MKKFTIFPAIDLKKGQCVRLLKGNYEDATIYEKNPFKQVELFIKFGFTNVHLIDLDSALGLSTNQKLISEIVRNFSNDIHIQLGGGIRSSKNIKYWLDQGIYRVIIGTLAHDNPQIINNLDLNYKKKLVLAIDVRNENIAINGWKKQLDVSPFDLISRLDMSYIDSIIYTDISRDGSLEGIDFDNLIKFSNKFNYPIIASGGVAYIKDIIKLKDLDKSNISGVVVGKAIYENKIKISDLINLIKE